MLVHWLERQALDRNIERTSANRGSQFKKIGRNNIARHAMSLTRVHTAADPATLRNGVTPPAQHTTASTKPPAARSTALPLERG